MSFSFMSTILFIFNYFFKRIKTVYHTCRSIWWIWQVATAWWSHQQLQAVLMGETLIFKQVCKNKNTPLTVNLKQLYLLCCLVTLCIISSCKFLFLSTLKCFTVVVTQRLHSCGDYFNSWPSAASFAPSFFFKL